MRRFSQQARRCLARQAPRITGTPSLGQFGFYRGASSSHPPIPNASMKNSVGSEHPSVLYSEGQPANLAERVSNLSAWTVTPSKMGLVRTFTFPTFAAAWRFMSVVADECKAKRHHPSWHNLYNRVTIEWTTHKPKGLSIKDAEMAEFCDRTADDIGLQ